jgi:hypothetical protein
MESHSESTNNSGVYKLTRSRVITPSTTVEEVEEYHKEMVSHGSTITLEQLCSCFIVLPDQLKVYANN